MRHLPLLRSFFGDTRGAAAVLIVLMATVILGATALAVDLGMVFNKRRALVTAADAGALAGATALTPASPDITNQDFSEAQAIQVAQANAGNADSVTAYADMNNLTVEVRVVQNVELTFARVLGIQSIPVSAVAVAEKRPVHSPVEGILPISIRDPRYAMNGEFCDPITDTDGDGVPDNACDIDGDGVWDGPFDASTPLDRTIWEMFDDVNGGNDGYVELRYEPGGGAMGNFTPLDLATESSTDPCYGKEAAGLYECQLTYGGFPTDPFSDIIYLETKTGNMPVATFDGIVDRILRAEALGDPECTPEAIARRSEALTDTTVSQSVVGRAASAGCPLVVPVPLVQQWPPGTSGSATVTAWVGFGIVNVCNKYGADPFATTGADLCKQTGATAVIMAKWLPDINFNAIAAPTGESAGMTYTVKLIK